MTTTTKVNKAQFGRAVVLYCVHNLIPTIQSFGCKVADSSSPLDKKDSLYTNGVISIRQVYIQTMLNHVEAGPSGKKMEKSGIETYYLNTYNEFFTDKSEPKEVSNEEIASVSAAVTAVIKQAVDNYTEKTAKKAAKDAEAAERRAAYEAKQAERKLIKEQKKIEAETKKAQRTAERLAKQEQRKKDQEAKEASKVAAKERKKEFQRIPTTAVS